MRSVHAASSPTATIFTIGGKILLAPSRVKRVLAFLDTFLQAFRALLTTTFAGRALHYVKRRQQRHPPRSRLASVRVNRATATFHQRSEHSDFRMIRSRLLASGLCSPS